MIVWLTGMAGTGKSTIARELAPWLKAIVLDSDDIRGCWTDLPRDLAGVTSPYEGPRNPIAVVDTTDAFAGIVQPETMARILEALHERGLERIGRDNAGAGI